MRILIAEDDIALAGFVRKGLEAEHYAVDVSSDGEQARAFATEFDYDLVVLDLNLPRLDGVSILKQVRSSKPNVPILVLTARSRVEDRVLCLDAGADDYLVKPFSFSELSARIRALARRSRLPQESVLTVEDLKLDRVERRVTRGSRRIELTSKEFALLEYLMRNAGRRVTRAMIIEHVWNLSFDSATNLVDVYVAFLRVVFEASLVSAEHLPFREYLHRLPEVTYMCSCKLAPMDVPALLQLDLSIAFPLIDLLLGGEGKGTLEPRDVTEIEEQILESVVQIICRELGIAWQALGLEFRFDRRQQAANALRLMPPDDKTLALSFGITMPETRGTLQLAVPAAVSTALLRKMSADWAYRKPQGPAESKEQVKARILNCPFEIELGVMGVRVPAEELVGMRPGGVLVFRHPVDSPATLLVGEQPLFQAFVMRHGRKRAARLNALSPKPKSAGKEPS
ncbi:MAG: response regulator [Terriglobales bacterium]